MLNIPGLENIEVLSETDHHVIYRGVDSGNRSPLLCKVLKKQFRDSSIAKQLRVEYEIGGSINSELTVHMYDWLLVDGLPAFLMEDFDGNPLTESPGFRLYSIEKYLKIALLITSALADMHQKDVAFCNLAPHNILYNPMTRRLKLTNFSQALRLQVTHPKSLLPIPFITLPYISPEQTGRLNKNIDHRSDFYSLGVCLYQIFSGSLPFSANNPAEYLHHHIAKEAPSAHEINREIPKVVSRIIRKLMDKSAENRYQSCKGVLHDLNICLKSLSAPDIIKDFSPGQKDISEIFQVSEKLYGRNREISMILDELNRICNGDSKFLLVTGPSGIGKSSLINGLRKAVAKQNGYFLTGKFDQSPSDLPYQPIIWAFQGLINQVLAEGEETVAHLRDEILSSIGKRGGLITAVIPELEFIIGKQPEFHYVSAEDQQHRFSAALSSFIQACCKEDSPLVIFLDDMQWADPATLKFIEQFLIKHKTSGILILGTSRNNEVDESHQLHLTLTRVSQSGKHLPIIHLPPLTHENIKNLIADTLFESRENVSELAKICHEKTNGNPFFIKQFLLAAHFEKHIVYDPNMGRWVWNERAISAMETTENLLPLQEQKLKTFNKDTLKILKFASCLGNSFNLDTLARVCLESKETVLKSLDKLSDIIIGIHTVAPIATSGEPPRNEQRPLYKFAHDRLQRAAYSLLSSKEIKKFHYQIGVQLKQDVSQLSEYPKVFDITGHLNIGADLIESSEEKLELAGMNLKAGTKALASSANFSAQNYLQVGLELLPENCWRNEYDISLSLHTLAAEAAYLCNNQDRVEEIFNIINKNGKSSLDMAPIYSIQIRALKARNMSTQALETGLAFLKQFGLKFPKRPNKFRAFFAFLKIRLLLSNKSDSDILNLPRLKNPSISAAMKILSDIGTAAYYSNTSLLPSLALNVIQLSMKHGNSPESAMGYVTYGFLECGVPFGSIDVGYKFGKLSLKLQQKNGENTPHTLYLVNNLINHWKEPIHKTISAIEKVHTDCMEIGDFEIASNSLYSCTYRYFFSGNNLEKIEEKITPYRENMERLGHVIPLYRHLLSLQIIENLRTGSIQQTELSGNHYSEDKYLQIHKRAKDHTTLFLVYFLRLIQNFTFNNYHKALEDLKQARKYQDSVTSSIYVPFFTYYSALTHLIISRTAPPLERAAHSLQINHLTRKLRKWSQNCPSSFLHKYYLVKAEGFRNSNKKEEAFHYYDLAMEEAEKNKCTQDIALAHELAASYFFILKRKETAFLHLSKSKDHYAAWGALAKVEQLTNFQKIFSKPQLIPKTDNLTQNPQTINTIASNIDLESMIKATKLLTGTIAEEDLLNNLLITMIENAGAQRGFLLFKKDGGWLARLEGNLEEDGVKIHTTRYHKNAKNLSLNIVSYVARTKESVVLANAGKEGLFIHDKYVLKNKPKSILCLPLIHQEKISCIVYLENNLTYGAFSGERQEVLHMLGSQAAISLKNSSLYGELETTIEKLHQEIKIRKDTQLQLLHAEKLTALGRLSASIAHEFGNPLIGIQYLLQDILDRFTLSLEDEKLIFIGVEECERMKLLIRDMQQLNRPSSGRKKLFNPHKAIENVLLFQKKNLSSHGINVVREYCNNFTFLHAVEDQVTQVLVNITLNAVDAMAENGGILTIVTNQDSEYTDIIIKDTGKGISEEDQKNIFEPFFSTKPDVEGTGLGLPVSYSIVKNHGGNITFSSTIGEGSAFHIRLPSNLSEKN